MQLDQFLSERRISAAAFGRMIGLARSTIHRYRRRQRMPRWEEQGRIEQVTLGQVTPNDFLEGLRHRGDQQR